MSVPCHDPEELTRLLDGELTENRAARLRAHAAACTGCAAELLARERLVDRIRAPLPGLPSEGALAAVMSRLDAADAAVRAPPPPRLTRGWMGLAAAAAALLVAVQLLPVRREDGFAARGAGVEWIQKIGVELWALQGQPRRLASGDNLARGVAVVASYSNVDPDTAWLLAFAIDARGEVHWLYPAYLDAARDPGAVPLQGAVVQRALPESVVLEEVPDGALRFVTVVSREPHRVSEIEAAPPADRTPEALRRRWPHARVDELNVRYAAPPPAVP
jgi:hypothetical protein